MGKIQRESQIRKILGNLRENALKIPGIAIGVFGSIAYRSPKPNGSDYDLMVIVDNESIPQLEGPEFMSRLFGKGIKVDSGTGVSTFPREDITDMLSGKINILQAGGDIDVLNWLPSESNLPKTIKVEFYAIKFNDLLRITALEPGGELFQRYNSSPTKKAIVPYNFVATNGLRIDYDQNIELISQDGRIFRLGDGTYETYTIDQAILQFIRYQKLSPGLPRVNLETGEITTEVSDSNPILIGTTGDKVLSLAMLVDPKNKVANELLVPTIKRVAKDFNDKWPNKQQNGQFAALYQRYNMGRFPAKTVSYIQQLYESAINGILESKDLTIDLEKYKLF